MAAASIYLATSNKGKSPKLVEPTKDTKPRQGDGGKASDDEAKKLAGDFWPVIRHGYRVYVWNEEKVGDNVTAYGAAPSPSTAPDSSYTKAVSSLREPLALMGMASSAMAGRGPADAPSWEVDFIKGSKAGIHDSYIIVTDNVFQNAKALQEIGIRDIPMPGNNPDRKPKVLFIITPDTSGFSDQNLYLKTVSQDLAEARANGLRALGIITNLHTPDATDTAGWDNWWLKTLPILAAQSAPSDIMVL